MSNDILNIEISCDTDEGAQFAEWLNAKGHSAHVGNTTGNRINGVSTSDCSNANETMRQLWDRYCAA
jgi:hypothetical protein